LLDQSGIDFAFFAASAFKRFAGSKVLVGD